VALFLLLYGTFAGLTELHLSYVTE